MVAGKEPFQHLFKISVSAPVIYILSKYLKLFSLTASGHCLLNNIWEGGTVNYAQYDGSWRFWMAASEINRN